MLFISVEDFFQKASEAVHLSRDEEKRLALEMENGNTDARQAIINSYLPMAAAHIRRAPEVLRTLHTVYRFIDSLEKGVDTFRFQQDGESFVHHLSWRFRQCITHCIADRY